MIKYKFAWKPSGTFSIGGTKKLIFLYQCVICHRDIPKEKTALTITATASNVHTSTLCIDCTAAITRENMRLPHDENKEFLPMEG